MKEKNLKQKKLISNIQMLSPNNGITLIALIITIIVMLILTAVSINVAINGGLFDNAREADILLIIDNLKTEMQMENIDSIINQEQITPEILLARGKVQRKVSGENDTYYMYYALKENAYEAMQGFGKGKSGYLRDVFLVDNNLNIRYIDKRGKEYGDVLEEKILADDTNIRFANKAFSEYVSRISGVEEEEMLFKWMKTQTSLSIDDATVTSLEDLVFFPNLTSLSISTVSTQLTSLDGIESCTKLKNVAIGWGMYDTITDVSALAMLPNLEQFVILRSGKNCWDNMIDTLKNVNTLKYLRVGRN